MSDLIDRQAAIDAVMITPQEWSGMYIQDLNCRLRDALNSLPSAQPEKTEYISETKAVQSTCDCVDLSERVTATYYDQEHEEWTKHNVTIADVLDSVCDDYTILPYVQPTIDAVPVIRCKDCAEWRLAGDGEGECYDGMADGAMTHEIDFCSWARRRTDDK